MKHKINIAIDGYSSCGKSTITKQIAEALDYIQIDTGVMYRAVTLYLLNHDVDIHDINAVESALENISLDFVKQDGKLMIQLNGAFVEDQIRGIKVSSHVSEVAAISVVRSFLVVQQRQIASNKGVVMDGRDIGTVVLPDAEVKFFITADKMVRVQRRYDELMAKGKTVTKQEVQQNLEHRDYIDSHRKDSPLTKAEDAILIDNTNLTREEQFDLIMRLIQNNLNSSISH